MKRFRLDVRTFCRKQGVQIMARRGSEAYILTSRRRNIDSRWGCIGKVAFLGFAFSFFSLLFTCESRFCSGPNIVLTAGVGPSGRGKGRVLSNYFA